MHKELANKRKYENKKTIESYSALEKKNLFVNELGNVPEI